jgi:hypothetical protein
MNHSDLVIRISIKSMLLVFIWMQPIVLNFRKFIKNKTLPCTMKPTNNLWLFFLTVLFFAIIPTTEAQVFLRGGLEISDDARTVIVEPDNYPAEIGSLNRTIQEEIAIDPETIFILLRDKVYWLDDTIINDGYRLHIKAEEGEGHPPIIRPGLSGEESFKNLFYSQSDAIFENLFLVAIDSDGVTRRPIVLQSRDKTIIIDNSYIVGTPDLSIWIKNKRNSLFVTNSVFANAGSVAYRDQGCFINTGGMNVDTLWVENTTIYNFKDCYLRSSGLIDYLHINHNTGVNIATNLNASRAVKATITNNLFLNFYTHGINSGSTSGIIAAEGYDWLADITDVGRIYNISNNNIGYLDNEHKESMVSLRDSRFAPDGGEAPILNSILRRWEEGRPWPGGIPTVIYENNITEGVVFTDPPDPIDEWTSAWLRRMNLPVVYDRWDEGAATEDPGAYHYNLQLLRDLSYTSGHLSFTSAENGFPLGDLNWFPKQKAAWEQGKNPVSADDEEPPVAEAFKIHGNYPNPFNPTTNIVYELASQVEVTMNVFNTLGQKVETVELGMQAAGLHETVYDASALSSGVYLVQVHMGSKVLLLKMTVLK